MVPVCGQLVVNKFPRFAHGKLNQIPSRSSGWDAAWKRKQITIGPRAELIAVETKQGHSDWIRAGHAKVLGEIGLGQRRCSTIGGGHVRNECADQSSGRVAAALTRALIVDEEEAQLSARDDRTTKAPHENILLYYGPRRSSLIQEIFVGIEDGVAEELVDVAVIAVGAALQDRIDVAASVAALGSVIE